MNRRLVILVLALGPAVVLMSCEELGAGGAAQVMCDKLVACGEMAPDKLADCRRRYEVTLKLLVDPPAAAECYDSLPCADMLGPGGNKCTQGTWNSVSCVDNNMHLCHGDGWCRDISCSDFCWALLGDTQGTCKPNKGDPLDLLRVCQCGQTAPPTGHNMQAACEAAAASMAKLPCGKTTSDALKKSCSSYGTNYPCDISGYFACYGSCWKCKDVAGTLVIDGTDCSKCTITSCS